MKKIEDGNPRNRAGRSRRAKAGPQFFEHPFSRIDKKVLRKALLATADKQAEAFPKLVENILTLFRNSYPPHILAVVAGYGLQVGIDKDGAQSRLGPSIEQHHVEVLQALALMVPRKEWGRSPATPQDIQGAFDTAKEVADAFYSRRFKRQNEESDQQQRAVLSLQERMRLHTQAVRNWGYYSQVIRISSELYAPLDCQFSDALGFSATDLITIAKHLVSSFEEKSNERLSWLRRVFRQKDCGGIVRTYFEYHPTIKSDPDEFLRAIPVGTSREEVLVRLLSHADLLLIDMMTFSSKEISVATGIREGIIEKVLTALAFVPGDLNDRDPEHILWPTLSG